MAKRPRGPQTPPDDPAYVASWARQLVAAVGKREARRIMEGYGALAANRRLAKLDRDTARQRAEALAALL